MSEHTKEPWSVYEGEDVPGVLDSDGSHIADMWKSKKEAKANARRIVACVNACAGIPTEDLEGESVLQTMTDQEKELMSAEAALDRVRSITVEEIRKVIKDCLGLNSLQTSALVHRLITERMEGK